MSSMPAGEVGDGITGTGGRVFVGDAVGVRVNVGVPVGVNVLVCVLVGVSDGVGVEVRVGVSVGVGVAVRVAVSVAVLVGVFVGVGVSGANGSDAVCIAADERLLSQFATAYRARCSISSGVPSLLGTASLRIWNSMRQKLGLPAGITTAGAAVKVTAFGAVPIA